MQVHVIDLCMQVNAHIVSWQDQYGNAASDPDGVTVDAATFRQAIKAFRVLTGRSINLATTRKRRWLGLLGSYDALTGSAATIARGRRRFVVKNVDEPLQEGDVILLDGLFC